MWLGFNWIGWISVFVILVELVLICLYLVVVSVNAWTCCFLLDSCYNCVFLYCLLFCFGFCCVDCLTVWFLNSIVDAKGNLDVVTIRPWCLVVDCCKFYFAGWWFNYGFTYVCVFGDFVDFVVLLFILFICCLECCCVWDCCFGFLLMSVLVFYLLLEVCCFSFLIAEWFAFGWLVCLFACLLFWFWFGVCVTC